MPGLTLASASVVSAVSETGDSSSPDVELLYDINGLAADAPHWFDRVMEWTGEYGTMFALALLMIGCWWSVRKRPGAPAAVAALVWAPLAAGIALIVNIPIRNFVERPRPFLDHEGLEVLVQGKDDYSFVSDHSTLAMALAVGIFVANRKYGLVAIVIGAFAGLSRVYMGVHYPTDVVGGFALGTAVALLFAPLAMLMLNPLVRTVAGSRAGWLVQAPSAVAVAVDGGEGREPIPGATGRRRRSERDRARDLAA